MYGVAAKVQVRQGMEGQVRELLNDHIVNSGMKSEMASEPLAAYLMMSEREQGSGMLFIMYLNEDIRNANRDGAFAPLRQYLVTDPEWLQGEVLYHFTQPGQS